MKELSVSKPKAAKFDARDKMFRHLFKFFLLPRSNLCSNNKAIIAHAY